MIVGGYTLDLYCDVPGGCPRNTTIAPVLPPDGVVSAANSPVEYIDEFGSRARAAARRDGWLLKRDGRAYCKDHRDGR